jgi:hypothetical protein
MDPLGRYLALPFIILGDFFMWFLRGIPTGQGVGLRYLAYGPFTKCLGKVKFHEDVIVSGLAAMEINDISFFMARCALYAEEMMISNRFFSPRQKLKLPL